MEDFLEVFFLVQDFQKISPDRNGILLRRCLLRQFACRLGWSQINILCFVFGQFASLWLLDSGTSVLLKTDLLLLKIKISMAWIKFVILRFII